MSRSTMTLSRHFLSEHSHLSSDARELTAILDQIALGGKLISRDLSVAGLMNALGTTGETNVQGETVQKLDQRANDTFVQAFEGYGGIVKALVSEEMEKPWEVGGGPALGSRQDGSYVVFIDPLDGSTNLDANLTVGSIFSVHKLPSAHQPDLSTQLLRRGVDQVAAGYVLYGPSTVMVYTAGAGVHQFVLDPGIGEFVLSASRLKMPPRGKVYSANEGNYPKWPRGVQRFIDFLREKDPNGERPYSSRYSGCLVADVHRFLSGGGVYLYPGEANKPEGKLRLMYEAAPLAFILEQAGGAASTGTQRIAGILPTTIHQRVPLIIGSREEVTLAEEFVCGTRQ